MWRHEHSWRKTAIIGIRVSLCYDLQTEQLNLLLISVTTLSAAKSTPSLHNHCSRQYRCRRQQTQNAEAEQGCVPRLTAPFLIMLLFSTVLSPFWPVDFIRQDSTGWKGRTTFTNTWVAYLIRGTIGNCWEPIFLIVLCFCSLLWTIIFYQNHPRGQKTYAGGILNIDYTLIYLITLHDIYSSGRAYFLLFGILLNYQSLKVYYFWLW